MSSETVNNETTTDDAAAPAEGQAEAKAAPAERGKLQRTAIGRVTSNKMHQTATVVVERRVKHPMYGKYVRRSKKFHVHDPDNAVNIGDVVQIKETRPISKTKSWALDRIVENARE